MSSAASHTPAYAEVDLTTCEREPIHVPGAIQPHGVLLALDEDLRPAMVSTNVGAMLGTPTEDAIIAEHRRELRRLSGDIDRLSISTTTAGSLVEELAADLNRELDRLRVQSAAWAQGPPDR